MFFPDPAAFNDGNFLPDDRHPWNVGDCTDPLCRLPVYGPDIGTPPIHYACDMNAAHRSIAA